MNSSSCISDVNYLVIVTECDCWNLYLFIAKIINLNILIVEPTALVYSEALLEVEQENSVAFVFSLLWAIFVDVDFI